MDKFWLVLYSLKEVRQALDRFYTFGVNLQCTFVTLLCLHQFTIVTFFIAELNQITTKTPEPS